MSHLLGEGGGFHVVSVFLIGIFMDLVVIIMRVPDN